MLSRSRFIDSFLIQWTAELRIGAANAMLAHGKKISEGLMPGAISWKEKAAALRVAAEHAADQVTQQSLLVLAQDCDALAEGERVSPAADTISATSDPPASDEASR
jgi:hypothetical protein